MAWGVMKDGDGHPKVLLMEPRGSSVQTGNLGALELHVFTMNRLWALDSSSVLIAALEDQSSVDLISKSTEEDLKPWPYSEVLVEGFEALDYLDNLKQGKRFTEATEAITFDGEMDRVYLSTPPKIVVIDYEMKRTMVLRKEGLPDVGLWNPWDKEAKALPGFGNKDYKAVVCIDSAAEGAQSILNHRKNGRAWWTYLQFHLVPATGKWTTLQNPSWST